MPTLDHNYNTVEFRQARSTLDAGWILDWIKRVTCFVRAAIVTPSERYLGWASEGTVLGRDVPVQFGCPVDDHETWTLGLNAEIQLQSALDLETGITTFVPLPDDESEGLTEWTVDSDIMS
jgi:hypothetical protein